MLVLHVVSRLMLYVLQTKLMHIIAPLHISLLANGIAYGLGTRAGEPSGDEDGDWRLRLEMDVEMEVVIVGAPTASWVVIFGAPEASWKFRFVSKRLLASFFKVVVVSGAPKGEQESTKKLPKRVQTTIYRPTNAVWS